MMTEQDIERIMLMKQQFVESFVEADDYDIDEEDEIELIELLKIEAHEDDDELNQGI